MRGQRIHRFNAADERGVSTRLVERRKDIGVADDGPHLGGRLAHGDIGIAE